MTSRTFAALVAALFVLVTGARLLSADEADAMLAELMAVVGMANETNRLANGYRVPVDPAFDR